jgi:uncharacterized protein (TIGR03435 family)
MLKFAVASIRPADPNQEGARLGPIPGGGLRVNNWSLAGLITFAYNIRDFQLSGGPGWISSTRFDILAKPERPEGPADFSGMTLEQHTTMIGRLRERTRHLLAERFQLVFHRDSKELPVYALIVPKGGHKLRASAEGGNQHMRAGRSQINAEGATTEMLAETLSRMVGRKVLNQTGLAGKFDFELAWTRDYGTSLPGKLTHPNDPDPSEIPGAVSVFTAIQEQLGLKLESTRGPVEIIVIDRVEKPSEN